MFELIVLILASLLNGVLGYVVYSKSPRSATNKLFFFLTVSIVAWSSVNYLSVHPILFSQLTWIRLVMFCAALLCLSVFLTFSTFPLREYGGSKKLRISAIIATSTVMLLTLTPAIFDSLVIKGDSVSPHPGPGIPLFGLLVFALLGGGIQKLLRNYFAAHGRQKDQLKYVLLGLAGTFSLIFLGNFLLVILF
jgi:hypothetical protein